MVIASAVLMDSLAFVESIINWGQRAIFSNIPLIL